MNNFPSISQSPNVSATVGIILFSSNYLFTRTHFQNSVFDEEKWKWKFTMGDWFSHSLNVEGNWLQWQFFFFHIISCEIRYFQSTGPAVLFRSPIEVLSAHNVPRNFLDGTRYLFNLLLQHFRFKMERGIYLDIFSCNKVEINLILRSK